MADLSALLSPQSVAIVGASPDVSVLRGRTLRVIRRHPYRGRLYPISRSHSEVQGLKAYPSVADVPERIDLAVLIIPAQAVPEELERCGRAGVKAALILASGFAEESGEGRELQQQIREIAARHGLIVCGPNTEGFANTAAALCPTFSPAMDELPSGLVPEWRTSGRVAVIAQSGGMGFAFFDRGRPKEIAFSYVVTTGNEACLEGFEVVEHLLDEGRTDVFLMFLENIKNAATFRRVAARALSAGKPIIVAKIGASEAGRRAAISHTAALAGEHVVYRAMFRRYAIVEGTDSEAMVDIANAFAVYRDRLPRGKRVGIGTASGGGGGWLADACVAAGLEVPELDAETRAKIDTHLPPYGTSQNPVDGTAQAIRQIGYSELARLIASSDRIDAVIMVVTARNTETFERERANLFAVARETRKPILMWSYTNPIPAAVKLLSEAGYPLFTNMHTCARAIAAMADYATRQRAQMAQVEDMQVRTGHPPLPVAIGSRPLCEYESLRVLKALGIDSCRAELVATADEAVRVAGDIGAAVALKIQSPDILHKSDLGGVELNLADAGTVRQAFDAIGRKARAARPTADVHGLLVQAMAPAGLEMIVGMRRDDVFGPMIMVGMGGIHAEVVRDVALAPAPLSVSQALELLGELRGSALLGGMRGQPPADTQALAQLIARLSELAVEHADSIEVIDLNPVIVHEAGRGVSVVDALIVPRCAGNDVTK